MFCHVRALSVRALLASLTAVLLVALATPLPRASATTSTRPGGAAEATGAPLVDADLAVDAARSAIADVGRAPAPPPGVDPTLARATAAATTPVEVVLETDDAPVVAAAVETGGGTVQRVRPEFGFVQATVAPSAVEGLAGRDDVDVVRRPERLLTYGRGNESLIPSGVSRLRSEGRNGGGQSIAVVDLGFTGLNAAVNSGDLPSGIAKVGKFCSNGVNGTTDHGTAVSELVYDISNAAITVICIDEAEDLPDVVDELATRGIRIVTFSVGYPFRGRGDGGTIAEMALADSFDRGILWFVAAGNLADGHWGGPSKTVTIGRSAGTDGQSGTDDDFDINAHTWATPAGCNPPDPANCDIFREVTVPAGGEVLIVLKWDAYPTTHEDYDLFLFDPEELSDPAGQSDSDEYLPVRCREQEPDRSFDPNSARVPCSSADDQAQVGDDAKPNTADDPDPRVPGAPFEAVYLVNDFGREKTFQIVVNKYFGPDNRLLDMYVIGDFHSIEHPDPGGSVSIPATEAKAMAVGAACYATFAVQPFSGVGPTIDGRKKPDVVGLDGMTTSVFGPADRCGTQGFIGTSAATPYVAAIATLLRQGNSGWTATQLRNAVRNAAIDEGTPGVDNVSGYGIVQFPPAGGRYVGNDPPTRLYESRSSKGGPGALAPGERLRLMVRGQAGVPDDAIAVVLNVTAINPSTQGYLSVYPDGNPFPGTSNLNFRAGGIVPNLVVATLGTNGKITIYNKDGNTDIVVDVLGWYVPAGGGSAAASSATGQAAAASAGTHLAINPPRRILDTRPDRPDGPRHVPLGENSSFALQVRGVGGVPNNATAVIMNVTAVNPTAFDSFVTVYPDGASTRPVASNLNFFRGQTVPNLVVATVGANGKVRFFNKNGDVDLIADVLGAYVPPGSGDTIGVNPPKRLMDTRDGTGGRLGAIGVNSAHQLLVRGAGGVPPEGTAVLLNVTVVSPTDSGFVTLYPSGGTRPNVSNLNFEANDLVSNAVVATIGPNGKVAVYNKTGSAHVIVDLLGYVVP